jgi:uncharacterized protein (DUF2062 family)
MSLFKRRETPGLLARIRESVWPSMGWRRTYHYYRHRIFRGGDSTHRITSGFAIGAAVSFSPFLGTHFLQSLLLAFLFRASAIAAFIGTSFCNPWTIAFIVWSDYKLGKYICGFFGPVKNVRLPAYINMEYFLDEPGPFLKYLMQHPWELLLPMAVGAYLIMPFAWAAAYAILYYPVHGVTLAYHRRRAKALAKRQAKRAAEKEAAR